MKLQIFLSICLFGLAIHAQKKAPNDRLELERSKDPEFDYKLLWNIFKFPTDWANLFDKKSFHITLNPDASVLAKPLTLEQWIPQTSSTKDATVRAYLRNYNRTVQVHFQRASDLPSAYYYQENKIICNTNREQIDWAKALPTEYRVTSMLQRFSPKNLKMRFTEREYFPQVATRVFEKDKKSKNDLAVFVSEHIKNSRNLYKWAEQNFGSKFDESKFQNIFIKLYKDLRYLEKLGFTYTDMNPTNVLIGPRDEAYLINLGNVITKNDTKICGVPHFILPEQYSPAEESKMSKVEAQSNLERALTWRFCYTVYRAVCYENEMMFQKRDFKELADWKKQDKSFLKYFGCGSSKISKDVQNLMDNCLVKTSGQVRFADLENDKWLNPQMETVVRSNPPMPLKK